MSSSTPGGTCLPVTAGVAGAAPHRSDAALRRTQDRSDAATPCVQGRPDAARSHDVVFIDGLEVFANHGVYPEENALGQKFVVSLALYVSTRAAGETDDLSCSVNYGEVAQFVDGYLRGHTFKLIEAVAEHLASELLHRYGLLDGLRVRVEKPWAPVGLPLRSVGVEIERWRAEEA